MTRVAPTFGYTLRAVVQGFLFLQTEGEESCTDVGLRWEPRKVVGVAIS